MTAERLRALRRGDELTGLGRYGEAAAVFSGVLGMDPEDVGAMCGLSNCLLALRRPREGLELAGRAAALDPERALAHSLRSRHLLALHRQREALAAAREGVRLRPDDYFALLTLFEVLHRRRDGREAEQTAARLVERYAGRAEPHNAVGRAALLRRDWRTAERAFREALRLRPQEPIYQSNLALTLERQGRKREAMALFEQAVRTDPGSSSARRQLAHAIDRRLAAIVGSGVLGVWVIVQLARLVPHQPGLLVVLAGAAVLVGAGVLAARWWWLRRLGEQVRLLYRWERRRARPMRLAAAAYVAVVAVACLMIALVAALLVRRSPEVAAAIALAAGLALAIGGPRLWRRRLRPLLEERYVPAGRG